MLGPDHPITLWAARALTQALAQLDEVDPARSLGDDTLQRSRRVLGPDHAIALYLSRATRTSHPPPAGDAAADGLDRPL